MVATMNHSMAQMVLDIVGDLLSKSKHIYIVFND